MSAQTITVRIGQGLLAPLTLDDSGTLREYGITIRYHGRRLMDVSGSPQALSRLAEHAEARLGPGWDIPPSEVRSCSAAATRIRAALAARSAQDMKP